MAAERRMAAGLVTDRDSATLHTDALGMAELYFRRLREGIYFASRIEPLTELSDGPLHQDDVAWASTLTLGAPVAGATPFEEIRRLDAATAWRATRHGLSLESFEPAWAREESRSSPEPREVIELIAEQIPKRRLFGRTAVTLSGGWDSRLLGALAARESRRSVLAWTTDPDIGHNRELKLSKPVAELLSLEQRVLVPPPRAWVRNAPIARMRLQHQIRHHTWLMPLARRLQERKEPLLDGLAGGVLLRGAFVDAETLRMPDHRPGVWRKIAGYPRADEKLLGRERAADIEAASRAAFEKAAEPTMGHRAGGALSVLCTRTARAIASAPLLLFGPSMDVRLPFVHPDVIAATLAVPPERKVDGVYYREILKALDPRLAVLPSTNDPLTTPIVRTARRQLHPEALRSMTELIRGDFEVGRLFEPAVLARLETRAGRAAVAGSGGLPVLQWAAMLAEWRAIYRDKLAT
jgi:hypothetical protein